MANGIFKKVSEKLANTDALKFGSLTGSLLVLGGVVVILLTSATSMSEIDEAMTEENADGEGEKSDTIEVEAEVIDATEE